MVGQGLHKPEALHFRCYHSILTLNVLDCRSHSLSTSARVVWIDEATRRGSRYAGWEVDELGDEVLLWNLLSVPVKPIFVTSAHIQLHHRVVENDAHLRNQYDSRRTKNETQAGELLPSPACIRTCTPNTSASPLAAWSCTEPFHCSLNGLVLRSWPTTAKFRRREVERPMMNHRIHHVPTWHAEWSLPRQKVPKEREVFGNDCVEIGDRTLSLRRPTLQIRVADALPGYGRKHARTPTCPFKVSRAVFTVQMHAIYRPAAAREPLFAYLSVLRFSSAGFGSRLRYCGLYTRYIVVRRA